MTPLLPHILFILTDQFRHDSYSASPNPSALPPSTPHLDAIATDGARFSRAYSSVPTCTPARSALLTGRSPWNHGMLGYNADVSCAGYTTTLPRVLGEAGYRTIAVGKDHFGFNATTHAAITQGYDDVMIYDAENGEKNDDDYTQYFRAIYGDDANPVASADPNVHIDYNTWRATSYVYNESDHPTAWTATVAIDYIDSFDFASCQESSLFLKASFHRPHSPYDPPKRLQDKYLAMLDNLPTRHLSDGGWDEQYINQTLPMENDAWRGDPGDVLSRETRAAYHASIEFVDENVGRVLAALEVCAVPR